MAITYASNLAALKAQTQINGNTDALSVTFERLSSGLRLNKASDGPADLQLADTLKTDAQVATFAIRNANDGISVSNIVDSALQELSSILYRMAELAEQSSNGAVENTQRSALQSEFLALGSEIERISRTTEFNDISLLSNSSDITIQVGLDGTSNSQVVLSGVLGTLSSLSLSSSGSSKLTYSLVTVSEAGSIDASSNALTAINTAIDTLAARRGTVGADESRLSFALSYLSVARENFLAAESRIRDADIAQEVAEQVRLQVLVQAGTAVLAQANQIPQVALSLLG